MNHPRHALSTRLWHWLNALCVIILFMSGLNISNAHRFLYWGDAGFDPADAWTAVIRFPGWATIPAYYNLAAARDWHFLFAWPFALGLLAFWVVILANRHFWRDLRTQREEWRWSNIREEIGNHLKLRFEPEAPRYNFLQRLAYGLVLGAMLPAMIFTGLAISPGFEPAAPWLVDLLGGRQSARSLHFLFAWAIFAFVIVHLAMWLLNRPLHHLRSMTFGGSE